MNQTLQLTDYIPQYVSLYYVDYRDDLDEHEDIQEECIRSNNMENSMKRHTIFSYICCIGTNYIYCIKLIIKYKYAYNTRLFK